MEIEASQVELVNCGMRATAALSNYLITFIGVPIAALWLGERLGAGAVVGGALVLVSTLLIALWKPGSAGALAAPEGS